MRQGEWERNRRTGEWRWVDALWDAQPPPPPLVLRTQGAGKGCAASAGDSFGGKGGSSAAPVEMGPAANAVPAAFVGVAASRTRDTNMDAEPSLEADSKRAKSSQQGDNQWTLEEAEQYAEYLSQSQALQSQKPKAPPGIPSPAQ